MQRNVSPEALDHLPPQDPMAQRSRRDLMRVHKAMRTREIVTRGWRALCPRPVAGRPLQILELGAGDGTLLLGVARQLGGRWPPVHLTLLDRQALVTPSTVAAYAALGWTATVQTVDALDWAQQPHGRSASAWDLVSTSLFLHHFEAEPLSVLLGAVAARSWRFFAFEPRRSALALAGSHLVGVIGANAVTRQDAVLSVHAGFRHREISAQWPCTLDAWHLRETSAGLFSHVFKAHRLETC
jgi:hypothetical protein